MHSYEKWLESLTHKFNNNMENTYILTSQKITGKATVIYKNTVLKAFKFDFHHRLNDVQYKAFINILLTAYNEGYVTDFEKIGMGVEKEVIEVPKNNDRIAAFCDAYKNHLGVKYQVEGFEAKKLKQSPQVKITPEYMAAYFTTEAW